MLPTHDDQKQGIVIRGEGMLQIATVLAGTREAALVEIGDEIHKTWLDEAQRGLASSFEDYADGLGSPVIEGSGVSVTLTGAFPNWIEQGIGPYDMKETLLKPGAPGVKISKEGKRYRNIRFVKADPRWMASQKAATGQFPRRIGKRGASHPDGKHSGFPLGTLDPRLMDAARRAKGGEKLRTATGRLLSRGRQGLRKVPRVGKSLPGNRFEVDQFRRISEDSEGWMSKGIRARHFADKVDRKLPEIVGRVITRLLKGHGL